MLTIAVDAMGGDHAPQSEVEGAVRAAKTLGVKVILVGQEDVVRRELATHHGSGDLPIEIVNARERITMEDSAARAVRAKRDSSMRVASRLVRDGVAQGFVSAGNTGAVMAASTLILRLHTAVTRAAIGAMLPTAREPLLLLDAGANVDCDAKELVGFAHLGAVYARDVLGRAEPSVGLLNIGEEDEKGNAVVKEAHQLLKTQNGFRYAGNVEGRDVPAGEARGQPLDVVVCDGFTGNIVLKFYESAGKVFVAYIKKDAPDILQRPDMQRVLEVFDWATYGGAPLLGVQGVSIICHGSSTAKAIKNAIRVAVQAVESHLDQDIEAELSRSQVTV